jgi:hypothetical protein
VRCGGFNITEVRTGTPERAPRELHPMKTIAGGGMTEERILGDFFRPRRERPSRRGETSLLAGPGGGEM